MKNNYKLLAKTARMVVLAACLIFISNMNTLAQTEWAVVRGERPPIDLRQVPADAYEPGKLMIKLKPGMAKSLPDNKIISAEKGSYVLTSVSTLDTLNNKYGVTRYKPLLYGYYETSSRALQYRERHEAWGFHLWFDLELDSLADVKAAVEAFSKLDEVEIAEPAYKIRHTALNFSDEKPEPEGSPNSNKNRWTPNDPMFEDQWHFHNTGQYEGSPGADISMKPAWDIEKGHSDVIVAVIDHGINWDHPDLAGNMWQNSEGHFGYNFVNNTPVITGERHGTLVAGVVAAESNNSVGIAGIAGGSGSGDGVRMMSCQVFHALNQHGYFIAPVFAADNGAAISQNSWAHSEPDVYEQAVLDAIDYFNVYGGGEVMNGGITIFAAGNESSSDCYYPGCYSGTMAVAGTNYWDWKAWYSNYGAWIDISAPGGDSSFSERGILSTYGHHGYLRAEGTSMACPQVSGVAALLISYAHRNGYVINNNEVWDLLVENTDDHYPQNPDYIGQLGSGRLNAHHALLALVDLLDGLIKPPATITATSIDTDQIDVVWTKNPDNHDVILLWSPDNTFGELMDGTVYTAGQSIAGGGYVLYRGSNTGFEHTDLEAATTYYYRAYSYDADNNYSSGRGTSATTFCSTVTTLPFTEDFNALPKKPECWEVIDHIGNGHVWHFGYIFRYGLHNPILDGYYAYVDPKPYGIEVILDTDLITPLFDFSDYSDATVSFNHTFKGAMHFIATGTFSYSIDDGNTWTQIQQWTNTAFNPEEYSIVLQDLGGQDQVRFKWNYSGNYSFYWAIDDIVISTLPPEISVMPSSLEFGFIASGDVSAAETYTVWGNKMESSPLTITAPQGFLVSPDGSNWSSAFDISFTPPMLDATIVYVQFAPTGEPAEYADNISNSGGGAAVVNVEVTGKSVLPPGTICAFAHEITELPFSRVDLTTQGSGNNYNMGNSNTCGTGFMEGEDYVFLFEPDEVIIVNISLYNTEINTGLFVFDGCPDDPETLCVAADYSFGNDPSLMAIELDGGISYYIVVSTAANVPHTSFDILIVENFCPDPEMLHVINVTGTYVDLTWTASVPGIWNIEWGEGGFVFGEGATIYGVSENPYTLYGLSPTTEYDFYVQQDCGGGATSNWVGPFKFWTDVLCPSPWMMPTVSNITHNSADLSWDQPYGTTAWDIDWGESWFMEGEGTLVEGITEVPYTLDGLNPETEYIFYVRSNCTENQHGVSEWSGMPGWFITLEDSSPALSVVPDARYVSQLAGVTTFDITSNTSWTVSESVDWLTVIPMSGSGNGMLTVQYEENTMPEPRSGEITVSADEVPDVIVTVYQAGTAPTYGQVSVYPESLTETHEEEPAITVQTITVTNTGAGMLEFDIDIEFHGDEKAAGNEWTVHVHGWNMGDEVTWELRDNTSAVILSGGPYGYNYNDVKTVITVNEPLQFYISAIGSWNDNTPTYAVYCGDETKVAGTLAGGTDALYSGLVCGETEMSWLSVAPSDGMLAPGLSMPVEVTFNSTVLVNGSKSPAYGTYYANINFTGNNMDVPQPEVVVPVELHFIDDEVEIYLSVTPAAQYVDAPAGTTTFEVSSNTHWIAETVYPWLEVLPVSGTGDETLIVTYEENISSDPREAEITVRAMELPDVVVTVLQNGVQEGVPLNRLVQNETVQDGDSECYDARETVTLQNFLVEAGGTAHIIAGESIIMLPGTLAKAGSYLHAWITLTEEFCSSLPEPLVAVREDTVLQLNETPTHLHKDGFFRVFPNPTPGFFTIEIFNIDNALDVTVYIFGMRGNMIEQVKTSGQRETHFDLTDQQPGIYLVRVLIGDQVGVEKVVKH